MFYKFGNIRGVDKVIAYLKGVPRGAKREAVIGVAEYMVGDERHGFKHDDSYVNTTRQQVYGRTFESDAQRRKVMAMIKSGEITPNRKYVPTQASQKYGYRLVKDGYGAVIENSEPGAYWTRTWGGWKNWRSATKVVQDNIRGAIRHATSRVNLFLRKR